MGKEGQVTLRIGLMGAGQVAARHAEGLAQMPDVRVTVVADVDRRRAETLAQGRRYAIVILLSVAAIITPPDILSQILLFIPLYALYEVSILLGRAVDVPPALAARLAMPVVATRIPPRLEALAAAIDG